MTVFVYALKNNINNEIYVGIALDPQRRLLDHNRGKNRYTKSFMPWRINFIEECNGWAEARKREIYCNLLPVKDSSTICKSSF